MLWFVRQQKLEGHTLSNFNYSVQKNIMTIEIHYNGLASDHAARKE